MSIFTFRNFNCWKSYKITEKLLFPSSIKITSFILTRAIETKIQMKVESVVQSCIINDKISQSYVKDTTSIFKYCIHDGVFLFSPPSPYSKE